MKTTWPAAAFTKAAEKVRETVSKYSVINLSSAKDEDAAIKLINFVFENL